MKKIKPNDDFSPYPPLILFALFYFCCLVIFGLIFGFRHWQDILTWCAVAFIVAMPRYRSGEINQVRSLRSEEEDEIRELLNEN